MSPNRVVAVATPLIFAPLAGAVAAWVAEHFPGFKVDPNALEEIFIAGALIALAPAAQWLHGWQKFEARQADAAKESVEAEEPAVLAAGESDELAELEDLAEIDDLSELDELDDLDELEGLEEDQELAGLGR
jgi:hypothetical protein